MKSCMKSFSIKTRAKVHAKHDSRLIGDVLHLLLLDPSILVYRKVRIRTGRNRSDCGRHCPQGNEVFLSPLIVLCWKPEYAA